METKYWLLQRSPWLVFPSQIIDVAGKLISPWLACWPSTLTTTWQTTWVRLPKTCNCFFLGTPSYLPTWTNLVIVTKGKPTNWFIYIRPSFCTSTDNAAKWRWKVEELGTPWVSRVRSTWSQFLCPQLGYTLHKCGWKYVETLRPSKCREGPFTCSISPPI